MSASIDPCYAVTENRNQSATLSTQTHVRCFRGQDRFHTVFASPLERRAHCAAVLAGAALPALIPGLFAALLPRPAPSPALLCRRTAAGAAAGAVAWHLLAVLFGAPVPRSHAHTARARAPRHSCLTGQL